MNEEKKPAVKGKVYVQKKSKIQELYDMFFSASPSEVVKGIIRNVLIPDAKYTLNNMWKKSGDMLMYGVEEGKKGSDGRRSYHKQYRSSNDRTAFNSDTKITAASSRADYWKTLEFERKGDADDLIEYLKDELDEYGEVRVDTVLEFAGLTNDIEPIHTKWGWDDLSGARAEISRGGRWKLVMPKMIPID